MRIYIGFKIEKHFFQLIAPFMEEREMIRLRIISKNWKTQFESILSRNFTFIFNRPKSYQELIKDYAEELKFEAKGYYWIHYPWYGYFTKFPEELEKDKKKIARAISQKYEKEMYEKYWIQHYSGHNESDRNKCAWEQPFIEFKYL